MVEAPKENPERTMAAEGTRPAGSRATALVQTVLIAFVLAAPALRCLTHPYVVDNDIWWHLATGDWIRAHHAVPHVDLFSRQLAGTPWHAYSWLFELLASALYSWLGLRGIVLLTAGMSLAIAAALFRMVRALQPDFSLAAVLTFAAGFSMVHLETPRPWLFTILAMVLVVDLVLRSRSDGKAARLWWIPLIFAVWANLHIQFVDGLVVLALAATEGLAGTRVASLRTKLPPWTMAAVTAASALATLANPYGWKIYQDAYALSTQSGVMSKIGELSAIPFRDAVDFTVLGLALAAVAVLGWQRRLVSLEAAWLAFACVVAFRSQRDVWVLAIMAAVVLASVRVERRTAVLPLAGWAAPAGMAIALLLMAAGFRLFGVTEAHLADLRAQGMPVRAVAAIQEKHLSGPLYNDFGWGGYLLWSLQQPVSVDGRAALYGDPRIDRSAGTWAGHPDWASDPQLKDAGTVIGPAGSPLTQLLRQDGRFRLVYEDKLAAVFVAAGR